MKKMTFLLFSVLWVVLSGCVQSSKKAGSQQLVQPRLLVEHSEESELSSVRTVMVAPVEFDFSARGAEAQSDIINQRLRDAVVGELRIKSIFASDAKKLTKSTTSAASSSEDAVAAAKSKGADAVVLVKVNRFSERKGTRVGVSEPAHLSFTVRILQTSDGLEIWRSHYLFRDQAFSENLLKAQQRIAYGKKDGPGWKDALTTMRTGFQESFAAIESLRAKSYLSMK